MNGSATTRALLLATPLRAPSAAMNSRHLIRSRRPRATATKFEPDRFGNLGVQRQFELRWRLHR
jgi:hypothetical protein